LAIEEEAAVTDAQETPKKPQLKTVGKGRMMTKEVVDALVAQYLSKFMSYKKAAQCAAFL
jgi:hypothetical protein